MDELIKRRTARLKHIQKSILEVVVDMVESRDKITGGHIKKLRNM